VKRKLAAVSALDSERWGLVTAKATGVKAADAPRLLRFCQQHGVRLLIARCSASQLGAAQALEAAGARLMDTLVYYARAIAGELPADVPSVPVREATASDAAAVREVAAASFKGYFGHYHADPALDRRQCDATYMDWAYRSCLSTNVADGVLVGEDAGRIVAFATLRLTSDAEGEGVLFGVAPQAQGRGVYRSLMVAAMNWCREHGRTRMVVSTQITNVAVQKVWTRLGFEPAGAQYTFHQWFSAPRRRAAAGRRRVPRRKAARGR
jgi:GNAT superfamily N-acetyltransferase